MAEKESAHNAASEGNFTLKKDSRTFLRDLLIDRLDECGWRQKIEALVQEKIDQHGADNVNCDELMAEIIPQAKALVPEELRKEMLIRVRDALKSTNEG